MTADGLQLIRWRPDKLASARRGLLNNTVVTSCPTILKRDGFGACARLGGVGVVVR